MKINSCFTLALLFLGCAIVSAQGYDIRTTGRNNLRAAPSLDGTFLETVPSGTVLHVVGASGRWLKINRNGNEVWMADWLGYSRVEGSEGTAPQPASNVPEQVDNCCFVDRQCHSAQDWENGYWAFQNGQCAAAGSQARTSSQPVSAPPADIDNCCFVDRLCQTDQQWAAGYHAFQNNECGAAASSPRASGRVIRTPTGVIIGDTSGLKILPSTGYTLDTPTGSFSNCCEGNWQCNSDADWSAGQVDFPNCQLPGRVLSIVGEPDFVAYYMQRLDELKKLPHRYDYVLTSLDKIQQITWEGEDCLAGFAHSSVGMFFRCWNGPFVNGWDKRESAVIVHEACHAHHYTPSRLFRDASNAVCDHYKEEVICRELELAVAIELESPPDVLSWIHGMVERTKAGQRENCAGD